jgi:branched-chain amino acid transport system substrate-binding protein
MGGFDMRRLGLWTVGAGALLAAGTAQAEIVVGLSTAMTGPISSIGIPYGRGMAAAHAYIGEIAGEKVRLVQLDDASDPSTASRNSRKFIEEEKADIIMGGSGVPSTMAMAAVATELKAPMIALSPMGPPPSGPDGPWVITVAQPPELMVAAVVERMKKDGIKNVGFIGFSDSWGDLVYNSLTKSAEPAGIKVGTNERYARADTTVTAQILKVVASRPDAVMNGGSGTPGALPFIALTERGFKGPLYGSHALINPDFVRVGGKAVEGVIAPTGPVIVAEQLPDTNPTKKVSLAFREVFQKVNNAPTTDAFSAYSFDAWLIFVEAAKKALAAGLKPGTAEFRKALRDNIASTKEVVGTHGVYNFTPGALYGVDERARVVVRLEGGQWKILP